MEIDTDGNKIVLPHHKQSSLCTNRLPYRQGRKLTAVKVYTVANESNHLLVFGVPALNLRQETKSLFMKFGKLLKFNISPEHPSEAFTDTYHAQYERIQSARIAKRMIDTKNFYGGSLHVCYAPEMETIDETRQKLWQRQKDVLYRLRNLPISEKKSEENEPVKEVRDEKVAKLNMGQVNTISYKKPKLSKNKRLREALDKFKKSNSSSIATKTHSGSANKAAAALDNDLNALNQSNSIVIIEKGPVPRKRLKENQDEPIEIIDCTSVNNEVVTNINEHLNYDKFGNEDIRKVPAKRSNKIIFHMNKDR